MKPWLKTGTMTKAEARRVAAAVTRRRGKKKLTPRIVDAPTTAPARKDDDDYAPGCTVHMLDVPKPRDNDSGDYFPSKWFDENYHVCGVTIRKAIHDGKNIGKRRGSGRNMLYSLPDCEAIWGKRARRC